MSSHFRLEAQLTCSICGRTYDEPRILPCLHTFCTKCIEGLDAFIPSLPSVRLASPNAAKSATSPTEMIPPAAASERSRTLDSAGDSGTSGYETEKSPTGSLARSTAFGSKNRTVLCPTCDSEVDLPPDGAGHLPLHYVLQSKALTVALDQHRGLCDLCVGEIRAVSWCADCQARICAFCAEAHKRQRLTGRHRVLPVEEANRRAAGRPWPVCVAHPTEELRLFCDACCTTVCRDCCVPGGAHRGHRVRFVAEAAEEKIGDLKQLLARALPQAQALRSGLASVRSAAEKVAARQARVCREVDAFVDEYVAALEAHRRGLQERARRACEARQRALRLQGIRLEQALEDVDTLCAFAEQLLSEGSDVEVLALLGLVAGRLAELAAQRHRLEPAADDFLELARDEPAGRVNGFALRGAIAAQKLCPAKCSLKGNAVPVARQGQKIDVTVITKDTEGQPMRKGGHGPRVELVSKEDANKTLTVKTADRKNGTYSASFVPEDTGLYWLSVTFQGNHIQGSPYPISVKTKWSAHSGVFHCCTFCSSSGNKERACGCGGTMPGGFKGCGHGHKGHPGKKHWSCCGKATENSECGRPSPKMYEFTI